MGVTAAVVPPEDDGKVSHRGSPLEIRRPTASSSGPGRAVGRCDARYQGRLQVATDNAFESVVASGEVTASGGRSTVRLKVTKLHPLTTYSIGSLHRACDGARPNETAPEYRPGVPVSFAFAACQDYVGRYYYAWKVLATTTPVDFVVHLGDYIYERTATPSFMTPTEARKIVLPDGLSLGGGTGDGGTGTAGAAPARRRRRSPTTRALSSSGARNLSARTGSSPSSASGDDHESPTIGWKDHSTHFNGARGDEKGDRPARGRRPGVVRVSARRRGARRPGGLSLDIKIYRKLRYGSTWSVSHRQRYYRDHHIIPEGR